MRIHDVTAKDLDELAPLMRAYCDFYRVDPSDEALRDLSTALLAEPREGVQLIARDDDGRPVGFATIYWGWQTLSAARTGLMNDLFVAPDVRGGGVGRALIDACRERCRERGIETLIWQTAKDNHTAQRLYDGIGATREEWLDYWIPASGELPAR